MLNEELGKYFEDMVQAENKIVNSVNLSIEDMENFAVRNALKGISFDSLKHAEMYMSAIALITEERHPLNENQLDKQREIVERHIKMEGEVIEKLEKIIPEVDNEKVSFILEAIISDERRHHKVLKKLQQVLVRGETVTDAEWWDSLFGDVPGLWT